MNENNSILIGGNTQKTVRLPLSMANRHGLIAGATGTGKTSGMRLLAEGFSKAGVPVFLADMKGDVSGMALPGEYSSKIEERLGPCQMTKEDWKGQGFPVRFWDVFGKKGIPVRATISELGPLMLSSLLDLSDAQQGVLTILFKAADDKGWELIDWKDLKSMISYLKDNRQELSDQYGQISSQSLNALQRSLLELENQGADNLFGEPSLNIEDWMTQTDGMGTINILEASELSENPMLYAMFMLWMLSEVYETLPEAGDLDKPKLVFFFDEAHLLFDDAPKALIDKINQVVRLIRSKGVGIYFISQAPSDLPDSVLSQLNNRIQFALRAYTPKEQKALKAAAQSFRPNPDFDTAQAIGALGTGMALVSVLEEKGVPGIVEQITIAPVESGFKALSDQQLNLISTRDPMMTDYLDEIDRFSAFEALTQQKEQEQENEEKKPASKTKTRRVEDNRRDVKETTRSTRSAKATASKRATKQSSGLEKSVKRAANSAARSVGRDIGRSITRNVLGNSKSAASKAASNFAGNLLGNILGDLFK